MERPLPNGWISQVDPNSGHRFYVDTKATPPRSIWVHPLEDEQYLREHPDAREKSSAADEKAPRYSAPPTPAATPGAGSSSDRAGYASPSGPKKKHGFLDKMKEKFVGTEEEREQERRHKAETKRQMMLLREQRHQEMLAQQAAAYQQQQREQQLYAEQQRAYGQQAQYAPQQYAYGMAMPLLGGLAGGLLLGEALDGFGGDGGDGGDW
ncbi:hypothetical protein K438DRAFT_1902360 [Mycena galopus ATCC 62051]|nr:hypothetical protein K438DRAFT_1902360 [Mycena galopus ATCC 62051]